MEQSHIVIVDPQTSYAELARAALTAQGYLVNQVAQQIQPLELFTSYQPDLLIVSVVPPQYSALALCQDLRSSSGVPILVIVDPSPKATIAASLQFGADDYICPPLHGHELLARVHALLRRVPPSGAPLVVGRGEIAIDQQRRMVAVRGDLVELTALEYTLLVKLARHAGQVVTHSGLLEEVEAQPYQLDRSYINVYIWHLRSKLERDPRRPQLLLAEQTGYQLVG